MLGGEPLIGRLATTPPLEISLCAPQPCSALLVPDFHVSLLSEHVIGGLSYVFPKFGYQACITLHVIPAYLANPIFFK